MQSLPLSRVTERVDQAIRLASRGIKVFPLHSLQKGSNAETICTCGKEGCESVAKHPIGAFGGWKEVATHDLKAVREMWNKVPFANVGVLCGKENGFFVLDVDGEEGMNTLQEWLLDHGEMPITWQVNTGNGMHLYYKYPEGFNVGNTRSSLGFGIDTRGDDGYVVGADSLHATGAIYTWAMGRSPHDIPLGEAPDYLLKMLKELYNAKLDEAELNNVEIGDYRQANPDALIQKAIELKRISKWFIDAIKGNRDAKDKSQSGIDMGIANCLVKNAWTDQEIVEFLYHQRVIKKAKLKWPGYYKATVAKARKWGGDVEDNVIEFKKAEAEMAAGVDTEEAIPILEEPTVRAFPLHVYPKPVRDFVYAVAEAIGQPPDLAAIHVLNVLGVAIGRTRRIEIDERRQQPSILFTIAVGESGLGKSSAFFNALEPLRNIQQRIKKEHDERMIEYHELKKAHQIDPKAHPEPPLPLLQQVVLKNTTMEALTDALQVNTRCLMIGRDEISGLLDSFGQYKSGKGSDESMILELHDESDITINRVKNDNPIMIFSPFCSITGNITPNTIKSFQGDRSENGFFQRFLISYPEERKKRHYEKGKGVKQSVYDAYEKVVDALFNLEFKRVGDEEKPEILYMTTEAEDLRAAFENRIIDDLNKDDFPKRMRGSWSKMITHHARFALILQMAWSVCGEASKYEIEGKTIKLASALAEYFLTHLKKAHFYLGSSANDERINEAIHAIKRNGGNIKKRDILRNRIAGCKKSSEVDALFQELVDLGYGEIGKIVPERGGRPSLYFKLY